MTRPFGDPDGLVICHKVGYSALPYCTVTFQEYWVSEYDRIGENMGRTTLISFPKARNSCTVLLIVQTGDSYAISPVSAPIACPEYLWSQVLFSPLIQCTVRTVVQVTFPFDSISSISLALGLAYVRRIERKLTLGNEVPSTSSAFPPRDCSSATGYVVSHCVHGVKYLWLKVLGLRHSVPGQLRGIKSSQFSAFCFFPGPRCSTNHLRSCFGEFTATLMWNCTYNENAACWTWILATWR